MSTEQTISATEIQPVEVCTRPGGMVSDVWLRTDIQEDIAEPQDEDGEPVAVWTATEAHLVIDGTPSAADIAEHFDEWWLDATYEPPSVSERLDEQTARLDGIEDGLMEVADLLAAALEV